MKKTIELLNQQIEYTFNRSKRAKRIWLTVRFDGTFKVTAPISESEKTIKEFINDKADWIVSKLNFYRRHPLQTLGVEKTRISEIKLMAHQLAAERLAYFNRYYGFKYKKITIRNQRARWGSCSASGNLSFNYRLALLPPEMADYVVIHELCHLKEFSHNKKFWALVEKTCPEHLRIRREMKKYLFR